MINVLSVLLHYPILVVADGRCFAESTEEAAGRLHFGALRSSPKEELDGFPEEGTGRLRFGALASSPTEELAVVTGERTDRLRF